MRTVLHVSAEGWATLFGRRYRCALGKAGVGKAKQEGDGITPVGRFEIRRLHVRKDRLGQVPARFPTRGIRKTDKWCDDVRHARYNRLVSSPFVARHEKMWRADHLYDLVLELGYNDNPPRRGRGSAIFLHVAARDYAPTEGCVALAIRDLRAVLPRLAKNAVVWISK